MKSEAKFLGDRWPIGVRSNLNSGWIPCSPDSLSSVDIREGASL